MQRTEELPRFLLKEFLPSKREEESDAGPEDAQGACNHKDGVPAVAAVAVLSSACLVPVIKEGRQIVWIARIRSVRVKV